MNGSAGTALLPSEELFTGTSRQPSTRLAFIGNNFGKFLFDRLALGGILGRNIWPTPY